MSKIKFEVIRDFDGNVDGYKLGDWYLMKHYYWDNEYSWIINQTGRGFYGHYEFHKALESGEISIVGSCKEGKQRLIELQNAN